MVIIASLYRKKANKNLDTDGNLFWIKIAFSVLKLFDIPLFIKDVLIRSLYQ